MFYWLRRNLRQLLPALNRELMYRHNLEFVQEVKPRIDVGIGELDEKNIELIHSVKHLDLERLRQRLKRGDKCYVGYVNNTVVSYHWVQFSGTHFIQQAGKKVEIQPREFWIYHVRVAENYKGNRINGFIYNKILNDAKLSGYVKGWVYTNFKNSANRKGLEKLGFQIDHVIYSMKFKNKYFQIFKAIPF